MLAATLLAAAPCHAALASRTMPGGGMPFEICRLEGMGATFPRSAVNIPAGAEYDEDVDRTKSYAADGSVDSGGSRTPQLRVATLMAVSITPQGFCVAAPVRLLGATKTAARGGDSDAIAAPGGKWDAFSAKDPLNLTYGYLKSAAE